jgi:hypothetical protein
MFSKNRVLYEKMWKNLARQAGHLRQNNKAQSFLHAEETWIQTHTQNMEYLLLFDSNNVYAKVNGLSFFSNMCAVILQVRLQ